MARNRIPVRIPPKRCIAAYIRVSTQRQAIEGDSLEAQQTAIRRYVEARPSEEGWDVKEIEYFIHAGRSAKDQKRPQLQRLRAAIESGTINTVIVTKLDRITRSVTDFADLLDFFRHHDVDFNSVREAMDTSQAMGRAMLAIIMVFARLERETTAERTRAIMEDRVECGLWNGGKTCGYGTDDEGRLAAEPEWAEIIRTEFFDAVERLGPDGAVRRSLREKGIKSPK